MKRSTIKLLYLVPMVVILVSAGFAQQAIKIGVVNSQEVLEKSVEGKRVMAQLQDKDKKNQAELSRRDEEIRQLQTKLNTQRLTLTQEALLNLSSDLDTKETARKRFFEDASREMNELANRLFQKIQNELLPIIEALGKEKGMDIIFDLSRSGAVYWSPTVDLTADVIQRYDAAKAPTKK